jgi:glycerol-1-phosphate dehydrogenase [NAD(P)+]
VLLSPLFIDIRAGAVTGLGDLLADRRISADGHVAVAVGPGQGEAVVEALQPALSNADVFTVRGGSLEAAGDLQAAVCVGISSEEGPPELGEAADVMVDGPAGFVEALRLLVS